MGDYHEWPRWVCESCQGAVVQNPLQWHMKRSLHYADQASSDRVCFFVIPVSDKPESAQHAFRVQVCLWRRSTYRSVQPVAVDTSLIVPVPQALSVVAELCRSLVDVIPD